MISNLLSGKSCKPCSEYSTSSCWQDVLRRLARWYLRRQLLEPCRGQLGLQLPGWIGVLILLLDEEAFLAGLFSSQPGQDKSSLQLFAKQREGDLSYVELFHEVT